MWILDWLFPPRCPYCNSVILSKEPACKNCTQNFPKNHKVKRISSGNVCIAPFEYEAEYKSAILNFKFGNKQCYAPQLAQAVCTAIAKEYGNIQFDIVTSVPLSKKHLKERGFNQSELLAKEIARQLSCQYKQLLIKTRNNKTQHNLPRKEREKNVRGVYKCCADLKDKHYNIILCDDILTTGFTLSECCRALGENTPSTIYPVTIAIVK